MNNALFKEENDLLLKNRIKAFALLNERNMTPVTSVNELIYKLAHSPCGFGDLCQAYFHPELPNELDTII